MNYNFEHFRKHLIWARSFCRQAQEFNRTPVWTPQVGDRTFFSLSGTRKTDRDSPLRIQLTDYRQFQVRRSAFYNIGNRKFRDVLIRQAQPVRAQSLIWFAEKCATAEVSAGGRHSVSVLVDDLRQRIRFTAGLPTRLIWLARTRRLYNITRTHAPTLHEAIEELIAQNGRSTVKTGTDRIPHLTTSVTDGGEAAARTAAESFIDPQKPRAGSGRPVSTPIAPLRAARLRSSPIRSNSAGFSCGRGVLVAFPE